MTWFRIDDGFGSHPKVLSIPRGATRLRAVGLWTALGTWCARQLTDGHFAAHMVEEHGGTKSDARNLVAAGLWEPTDDGYRFHDWLHYNPSREKVETDRAEARERMAARRAKKKPSPTPGPPSGSQIVQPNTEGTSSGVQAPRPDPTRPPAAAAAEREPRPPPLEILRTRLEAATIPPVIWSGLTPTQSTEIEDLIGLHGDATLVKAALVAHRPEHPAAYAQAWLGRWRELRAPGSGLALVRPQRCTTHDWVQLDDAGICRACAGEKNAGGL